MLGATYSGKGTVASRDKPRFIPHYGSKWRIAHLYPKPLYPTIIEPFAGGAGYSLEYPWLDVRLIDMDERTVAVWDYLIHVSVEDMLAIPIVDNVVDLPDKYGQEVRWFVGWWLQPAASGGPSKRISTWGKTASESNRAGFWSDKCRERVAGQLDKIRHWSIRQGSYLDFEPTFPATWFVDPPYIDRGKYYRHGSKDIDYQSLGAWCRGLPGQVIVCENEGADWLPFEFLCDQHGVSHHKNTEVVWYK